MSKDMTLKGWRELRGLTREDLAERVGVTASMVERWEEVGLDGEPNSLYGDRLAGLLMDALGVGSTDGSLRIEHVPSEPNPGDIIVTADVGIEMEDLLKLARNKPDAIKIAVPNAWDLSIKPVYELTEADHAAMADYHAREMAHAQRMLSRLGNARELLGGNSGEWKPGQTVAERLEDLDREIGEDLDGGAAG